MNTQKCYSNHRDDVEISTHWANLSFLLNPQVWNDLRQYLCNFKEIQIQSVSYCVHMTTNNMFDSIFFFNLIDFHFLWTFENCWMFWGHIISLNLKK